MHLKHFGIVHAVALVWKGATLMDVPGHFQRYPCEDYFASEWSVSGFWCEPSQLMVVVPAAEVEELAEIGFLSIGRAGVDGILFGYRAGEPGLWAYYPIAREFEPIAASVADLVRRWVAGEVRV